VRIIAKLDGLKFGGGTMAGALGRYWYYFLVILAVFSVEMIVWSYVNPKSVAQFLAPYSKNSGVILGVLFLTVSLTWLATVLLSHHLRRSAYYWWSRRSLD
jgi:hypothetical protein